jgi:hypothetical protein
VDSIYTCPCEDNNLYSLYTEAILKTAPTKESKVGYTVKSKLLVLTDLKYKNASVYDLLPFSTTTKMY